ILGCILFLAFCQRDCTEAACVHHEEHVMHDCVQLDHVVDSHDNYTSDSNIILCGQYVKDNEVPVIHSDLSYVPDDAFMMTYDDMCEPHDQPVFYPSRNTVVKNSLTAELATYKEQVELITPTAITDGERGFEQTKACYLQEVISFFKTIKDYFEGIQKALTKEVKEMKDVFKELEAEVSQCVIDMKHDAIDRKNLLIANDNLIAECLSKEITRAKHIEQVTKLTAENVRLKTSVSKAKVQPPVLTRTKHAVDVEPIVPRLRNNRDAHLDYLRHLKESVETIRNIVEEAKVVRPLDRSIVSAYRYTKHSHELLEYTIGTCPQGSQQ
nr:retrovirus-related Pol polyprotein from transposon TNT 1-94 [Tanacetum cinerariifolium]